MWKFEGFSEWNPRLQGCKIRGNELRPHERERNVYYSLFQRPVVRTTCNEMFCVCVNFWVTYWYRYRYNPTHSPFKDSKEGTCIWGEDIYRAIYTPLNFSISLNFLVTTSCTRYIKYVCVCNTGPCIIGICFCLKIIYNNPLIIV